MENLKISFCLSEMPCYGISHKGGRKTFEFQAFDGILSCGIPYDYNRNPLMLTGKVRTGDRVDIILMPHRIELYINGRLTDEEWPKGRRLFDAGEKICSAVEIEIGEYAEKAKNEPAVLSTFRGAEGWYPGGGVFVGDCMPYLRDGEYHVLYLKDRHHHGSKWGLGAHQWEHISTSDFNEWRIHPMAVEITEPDEGSICTGSWIRSGKTEYLYYTVRKGDGRPAPIQRSVSADGYHFEKDKTFGFTVSDRYNAASARDPKVIFGEDGLYHMLLTTGLSGENKGCLAHFVSENMETWEDAGEPLYISADDTEPECPDYFKYRNRYYLIYSLHGRAHYLVSERPFSGWRVPKNPVIPCATVPKCAEWKGRLVFTGFRGMGGYGGSMTFRSAVAEENGELVFE